MYREMSRLLFPLVVAISGIAMMTVLGQSPSACATAPTAQCPRIAPVALPDKLPTEHFVGARTARPLRVSLPDFLNLGAPPRSRSVEVIK